jgi:segregation and condensation protein A
MSYEIATDVYQGPFELLLQLIMSDEVDIWEVKLSEIIEAFLAEGEKLKNERIDLDVATEFLLVASTLIEIKVKRLLPRPEVVDLDEELLQFEYRDLLLARLLECKTFKDVASVFEKMMSVSALSIPRRMPVEEPFFSLAPDPLEQTAIEKLAMAYKRAFTAPEKPEVSIIHLHEHTISVKDAVDEMMHRLHGGMRSSFREMMYDAPSKLYVVVSFLAILELYKQGIIDIDSAETMGDLQLQLLDENANDDINVNADDWGETPLEVAKG